ncbi:MAG: prephenate dehydratase [Candidatus Sericytochromatia bacterium]
MRVAFQGEPGAYSEAAVLQHYGPAVEPVPCPSFDRVFEAVAHGEVDAGLVPIENSLAGSILENYDLLLAHELPIIGEERLSVRHCLLAKPGTRLEDVRVAYSHPQALAQSMPFLKAHGIEARPAYDTAGSARELASRDEPGAAAIASRRAAEIYGLEVLAEGIQTRQDNTTRFFAIALERPADLPREKASLVFSAPNVPGALYAGLGVLADHGLNMTKLESRPTKDTPWEYFFYVDLESPDLSPELFSALNADLLARGVTFARVLGVYPKAPPSR